MTSKFYDIAGLKIRIDSDRTIGNSDRYAEFYSQSGKADIETAIISSPLPPKNGAGIKTGGDRIFFYDEKGKLNLYSYYYTPGGEKEYACRTEENGRFTLFIDYPDGLWDSMIFNALNLPEILEMRGIFLCHSSFIIHRGEAILFIGSKGAGKSTQAALWEKHAGAKIINGDRTLLKFEGGRLNASGTPYCGSSKIALNESAPVKALILTGKADKNELKKSEGTQALIKITEQLSYEFYQNTQAVEFAAEICGNTPVYSLDCLPDESAVKLLEETLWKI